jgi:hypothetical protein
MRQNISEEQPILQIYILRYLKMDRTKLFDSVGKLCKYVKENTLHNLMQKRPKFKTNTLWIRILKKQPIFFACGYSLSINRAVIVRILCAIWQYGVNIMPG